MSVFAFLSNQAASQQQITNPGFENWHHLTDGILMPVNWNSVKNSDASEFILRMVPDVVFQSSDAHSGEYCVKLQNEELFGNVVNGVLTNGCIHAVSNKSECYIYTNPDVSTYNTPFTSRPDSLAGWYEYSPQDGDKPFVKVLLHKGKASVPAFETKANWIGIAEVLFPSEKVAEWKRFSVPFTYFTNENPEYILVIISSGDGLNAKKGSVGYFDGLKLIYNNH